MLQRGWLSCREIGFLDGGGVKASWMIRALVSHVDEQYSRRGEVAIDGSYNDAERSLQLIHPGNFGKSSVYCCLC